jgi:hypothetical protein
VSDNAGWAGFVVGVVAAAVAGFSLYMIYNNQVPTNNDQSSFNRNQSSFNKAQQTFNAYQAAFVKASLEQMVAEQNVTDVAAIRNPFPDVLRKRQTADQLLQNATDHVSANQLGRAIKAYRAVIDTTRVAANEQIADLTKQYSSTLPHAKAALKALQQCPPCEILSLEPRLVFRNGPGTILPSTLSGSQARGGTTH